MTDRLLSMRELSECLGDLSRATIYRHIKSLPEFPQPIKIGSATRFRQSDIQAFIQSRSETLHRR